MHHSPTLSLQGGQAASEVTLALLPMLAYGSLDEQDWRRLSSTDCVQFIQLAQCGLQYLLQEVASLHAKLVINMYSSAHTVVFSYS